jgi:hypothetical protein
MDIFLMVLETLGEGSFYSMHTRERQALCKIVRQQHCVNSYQMFKEELRYLSSGGQSSDCPLARSATVLRRNY